MGETLEYRHLWRMLKTTLTERIITLLFYKDLLIITYFVMYFWDDQENLMMPEYLKISPSIRSVCKEHFYPEPCLDRKNISIPYFYFNSIFYISIFSFSISYFYSINDIGRFSLSTRGIYYKALCWLWRFDSTGNEIQCCIK